MRHINLRELLLVFLVVIALGILLFFLKNIFVSSRIKVSSESSKLKISKIDYGEINSLIAQLNIFKPYGVVEIINGKYTRQTVNKLLIIFVDNQRDEGMVWTKNVEPVSNYHFSVDSKGNGTLSVWVNTEKILNLSKTVNYYLIKDLTDIARRDKFSTNETDQNDFVNNIFRSILNKNRLPVTFLEK